jgi:NADH:ubiquinone oxidoreductase subunit 5 (chain L)/Multisubunit Na+/H+ antiporter, MnhA subunit
MAVFPLIYAALADDLRRLLAYALVSQLGFMVVGIGVGGDLALRGSAAHAVAFVLLAGLLFMITGTIIQRTGTAKISCLGGLGRVMPATAVLWVLASLALAGAPLFAGYVSTSMILGAVQSAGHYVALAALSFALAGSVVVIGLRVLVSAFFDARLPPETRGSPINMFAATAVAAALTVAIGTYPWVLSDRVPGMADYRYFTAQDTLGRVQLLVFAALAFAILVWIRLYPRENTGTPIDAEWLYRWLAPRAIARVAAVVVVLDRAWRKIAFSDHSSRPCPSPNRHHGERGLFARTTSSGGMALITLGLLAAILAALYF